MTFSDYNNAHFTQSSLSSLGARKDLAGLALEAHSRSPETYFRDLPLFTPASLWARFFAIQECFLASQSVPGSILDFGTYRGSTAILLQNLKAIYDPWSMKRIYAFDTFDGYIGIAEGDSSAESITNGTYHPGREDYPSYLRTISKLQTVSNGKPSISDEFDVVPVAGDAPSRLEKLIQLDHVGAVSLAFFDLNNMAATHRVLEMLADRVVPGTIFAFWQWDRLELPGERRAFRKVRELFPKFTVRTSKTYPSLSYLAFQ